MEKELLHPRQRKRSCIQHGKKDSRIQDRERVPASSTKKGDLHLGQRKGVCIQGRERAPISGTEMNSVFMGTPGAVNT